MTEKFASEGTDGSNGLPRSLATLVINVWREAEHAEPLRARITARTDDSEGITAYAATEEAVLSEVRRWLQGLAGGQ